MSVSNQKDLIQTADDQEDRERQARAGPQRQPNLERSGLTPQPKLRRTPVKPNPIVQEEVPVRVDDNEDSESSSSESSSSESTLQSEDADNDNSNWEDLLSDEEEMALSAEQLQQLLERISLNGRSGGTKKLSAYGSGKETDFLTWRTHFTVVAEINNWNDLRQRREAFGAMENPAARLVSDLLYEDIPENDIPLGGHQRTIKDVLDSMESRFLTTAASRLARVSFNEAQQLAEESILTWHGRIRDLYIRAYPLMRAEEVMNNDPNLIDQFVIGIHRSQLKNEVYLKTPETFSSALTVAANTDAAMQALKAYEITPIRRGIVKREINAVAGVVVGTDSNGTESHVQCYVCHEYGHRFRACPTVPSGFIYAGNRGNNNPSGPSYPTSNRGSRGQGGFRGRGRGGNGRSIGASPNFSNNNRSRFPNQRGGNRRQVNFMEQPYEETYEGIREDTHERQEAPVRQGPTASPARSGN